MENALSPIGLLPNNRKEVEIWVNKVIEELVNGNYDPAQMFVRLRVISDAIKKVTDSDLIKNLAIEEIKKYNGDCSILGNKVIVATRKAWDFSNCGDANLNSLEAQAEAIKKAIDDRKKFLQSLKPGFTAVDDNGSIINPPAFTETEYITVK